MACASVIRPAQVSLQYETAAMCLLSKVLCLTRVPLVKENRHRLRFLLPASIGVSGSHFLFSLSLGYIGQKGKPFCGCRGLGQSSHLLCSRPVDAEVSHPVFFASWVIARILYTHTARLSRNRSSPHKL